MLLYNLHKGHIIIALISFVRKYHPFYTHLFYNMFAYLYKYAAGEKVFAHPDLFIIILYM